MRTSLVFTASCFGTPVECDHKYLTSLLKFDFCGACQHNAWVESQHFYFNVYVRIMYVITTPDITHVIKVVDLLLLNTSLVFSSFSV